MRSIFEDVLYRGRRAQSKTLHVFSDASERAIAACVYVKRVTRDNGIHVGFVFGKSKVAPKAGHTIPRLELCASVLAIEIGEMLSGELDIPLQDICYYSDSNVVLGYISNEQRRFYVYLSNRVARIRKSSPPDQWQYVATDSNPADDGTRGLSPGDLMSSQWLSGPAFLGKSSSQEFLPSFDLVEPDQDAEVRPLVTAKKTQTMVRSLGLSRFARFGTWKSLIRAVQTIQFRLRPLKGHD